MAKTIPPGSVGYITGPGSSPSGFTQGSVNNGNVVTPVLLADMGTMINALAAGESSVYSLTADGTGAATVTPAPAGTVKVSTAAQSTTVPSPIAVGLGELYKDMVPIAMAIFTAANPPVITRAVNLTSVNRQGAGQYRVQIQATAPNGLFPLTQVFSTSAASFATCNIIGGTSFDVYTWNAAGSQTDTSATIYVMVWAF